MRCMRELLSTRLHTVVDTLSSRNLMDVNPHLYSASVAGQERVDALRPSTPAAHSYVLLRRARNRYAACCIDLFLLQLQEASDVCCRQLQDMQLAIFLCRVVFATRCAAAGPLLEDAAGAAAGFPAAATAAAAVPGAGAAATPDDLLLSAALSAPRSSSASPPYPAAASAAASPGPDAAAVIAEYRDLLLRRLVTVAAAAEDLWLLHLALWLAGQHAAALFVLLPPQQRCCPAPLSALPLPAPAPPTAAPAASAAVPTASAAAVYAALALAPAAWPAHTTASALPPPPPLLSALNTPVYLSSASHVAQPSAQQEAGASSVRQQTPAGGAGGGGAAGGAPLQQQQQPSPRSGGQQARAAAEPVLSTRRGGGASAAYVSHSLHTALERSSLSAAVVPYLSVLLASRPLRHLAAHLQTSLPLLQHQLLLQRKKETSAAEHQQQQHVPRSRKQQSTHEPRQQPPTQTQQDDAHLLDEQQLLLQQDRAFASQQPVELPLQRAERYSEGVQQSGSLHVDRASETAAMNTGPASAGASSNALLQQASSGEASLGALPAGLGTSGKRSSVVQQNRSTFFGEEDSRGIEAAPAGFGGAASAAAAGGGAPAEEQQATAMTEAEAATEESKQQHRIAAAVSVAGVTEAVVVGETCHWALANPTAVAAGEYYFMSVTYARTRQPLLAALSATSFLSLASAGAFHTSENVPWDGASSSSTGATDRRSSGSSRRSDITSSSNQNRKVSDRWDEDATRTDTRDVRGDSQATRSAAASPPCCGFSSYICSPPVLLALPTVYVVFRSLFSSWAAEPACCHNAATSLLGATAATHSSRRYEDQLSCQFNARHAQRQTQHADGLRGDRAAAGSLVGAGGAAAAAISTVAAATPSVVALLTGLSTAAFLLLPCSPFAVSAAAAPVAAGGTASDATSLPLAMSFSLAYCVGSLVGSPFLLLPAFDGAAAAAASVSFAAARGSFAADTVAADGGPAAAAGEDAAAAAGDAAAASHAALGISSSSSREGRSSRGMQQETLAVPTSTAAPKGTLATARAAGEKDTVDIRYDSERDGSAAVALRGLAVLDAIAAQLLLEEGGHGHVLCHCCGSGPRSSSSPRRGSGGNSYSPAKRLLRLLQDGEKCGGGARRIARAAAETVARSVVETTAASAVRQQLLKQASQQLLQDSVGWTAAAADKAAGAGAHDEQLALLPQKKPTTAAGVAVALQDGHSEDQHRRESSSGVAAAATRAGAVEEDAAAFAIRTAAATAPGEGRALRSFLFEETEHLATCLFWAALRAAALARRSVSRSHVLLPPPQFAAAAREEAATKCSRLDYWEWRSVRAAWKLGRLSAACWRRQLLLIDARTSSSMARVSATYPLPDAHLSLRAARHIFVAGAAAAAAAATAEDAVAKMKSYGSAGHEGSCSGKSYHTQDAAAARGAWPADSTRSETTGEAGESGGRRAVVAARYSSPGSSMKRTTGRRAAGQGGEITAAAAEYYAALQVLLQELLLVFGRPEQQICSPASLLCCCAAVIKACTLTGAATEGTTDQQSSSSSNLRIGRSSSSSSNCLSPTARQRRFFLLHSGGADLTLLQLRQLAALVLAALAVAVASFAAAVPSVSLVFLVPRTAACFHSDAIASCGSRIAGLTPRSSSSTTRSSTTSSSTTSSSTGARREEKKGIAAKESRSSSPDDADVASAAAVSDRNACVLSASLACTSASGTRSLLSPLANVLRLVVGVQLLLQQPERTDWLQQLLAYLWLAVYSLSASGWSSKRGDSSSSAKRRPETRISIATSNNLPSVDIATADATAAAAAMRAAAASEGGAKRAERGAITRAPQRGTRDKDDTRDSLAKRRAMHCLGACLVVKAFEFFVDVLHTLQGEMLRSLHVLHLLRASQMYWQQSWLAQSAPGAAATDHVAEEQEQQYPPPESQAATEQWQQQQQRREVQKGEEPAWCCCCDDGNSSYAAAAAEIAVLRGWLGQLCYCLSGFVCTHLRPQLTAAAPAAAPLLLPLLCLSRASAQEQQQDGGGEGTPSCLTQLLQRLRTLPSPPGKCACGADNTFVGSSTAASVALLCDEEMLYALFGCAATARLWLILGCTRRLRWLYGQLPFLPLPQPALPSSLGAAASSAAALCTRKLQQKIKEEGKRSSTVQAAEKLALRTSTRRQGETEVAAGAGSLQQQQQRPHGQRQQQTGGQPNVKDIQRHTEAGAAVCERVRSSSEKPAPQRERALSAEQTEPTEQLLQQQLTQAGVSMLLPEGSSAARGGTHQRSGRRKGGETQAAAGSLTVQQQRAAASLPTLKAAEELMEKTGRPGVPCVLTGIFPPDNVKYVAASKAATNALETLAKAPGTRFPSVTSPQALLQLLWKQRWTNAISSSPSCSAPPFLLGNTGGCGVLLKGDPVAEGALTGRGERSRILPHTPWWSCLRCSVPVAAVWGPITRACRSSSHRRCGSIPAAAAATSSDIVFGIGPLSGGSGPSCYALRTVRVPDALVGEAAAAASPSTCTAALLSAAAAAVHATAAAAAAAAAEQAELSDDRSDAARKPPHCTPAATLEMEAWSRLSASRSVSLVNEAGGSGGAFVGVAAVRRATVNSAPELQRELLFCEQLQAQQQLQAPQLQCAGCTAGAELSPAACAAESNSRGWSSNSSSEERERVTAQVIASGIEESSCVLSMWLGWVLARDTALYSYVQVNRMSSAMRMLAGASTSAAAVAAAVRAQQEAREQYRLSACAQPPLPEEPQKLALPLVSSSVVLRLPLPTHSSGATPVSQHVSAPASARAAGAAAGAAAAAQPPRQPSAAVPYMTAAELAASAPPAAAFAASHRRSRQQAAERYAGTQASQQPKLPPTHVAAASGSVSPLFPYQAFASLSVLRSTFCFAGAMQEHPSLPVFAAALYRLQGIPPLQKRGSSDVFPRPASSSCFGLILRPYGAHARALPRAAAGISLPVVSPTAATVVATSSSSSATATARRSVQKTVVFADAAREGHGGDHAPWPDRSRSAPAAAAAEARAAGDLGNKSLLASAGTHTAQQAVPPTSQEHSDLRDITPNSSRPAAAAAVFCQGVQEQQTAQPRNEPEPQASASAEDISRRSTSFFNPSPAAEADVVAGSAKHSSSSGSKRKHGSERNAGSTTAEAGRSSGYGAAASHSVWGVSSTHRSGSKPAATAARSACGTTQVTAAVWNEQGDQLFVADTSGWVNLYTILRGPLLPPMAGAAVAAAATAAANAEAAAAGKSMKEDPAAAVWEEKSVLASLEQLLRPAVAWKAHQGAVEDALVLDGSGTWLLTRGCGVPPHALRQNPLLVEGDPSTAAAPESRAGHDKKSDRHLQTEDDAQHQVDDDVFDGWHFFDRLRAAEENAPSHFDAADAASRDAHCRAAIASSTAHGQGESLLLRRARPVLLRRRARRGDTRVQEETGSSSSASSAQEDDSDSSGTKAFSSTAATPRSDRSRAGLLASYEQHALLRLSASTCASPHAGRSRHGGARTQDNKDVKGAAAETVLDQGGQLLSEGTGGEENSSADEGSSPAPFDQGLTWNKEFSCFPQLLQEQQPLPCCRESPALLTKLHARLLRRLSQQRHRAGARNLRQEEEGVTAAAAAGEGAEDRSSGTSGDAWRANALPLQQWASGLFNLTSGFPAAGGSSSSNPSNAESTSRPFAGRGEGKREPAFLEWARDAVSSAAVPSLRGDDLRRPHESMGSYGLLEQDEQQELAPITGSTQPPSSYSRKQRSRKHFPSIEGECICVWNVWDVSEGGGPRLDCVFTCDDELLVRVQELFFPAIYSRSTSPLRPSGEGAGERDTRTAFSGGLQDPGSRSHSRSSSVGFARRPLRSGTTGGRAAAAAAAAEFFETFNPNVAGEESDPDENDGDAAVEWVVTPTHTPSCVTLGILQDAVTSCRCWRCAYACAPPVCCSCGSGGREVSACSDDCFPSQASRHTASRWKSTTTKGRSFGRGAHNGVYPKNTARRCILYGDAAGWMHALDLGRQEEVCRWRAHPSCVVSCGVSCMAATIPCTDRFTASMFPASWLITASAAPAADATLRCWSLSALNGCVPFLLFEFHSPAHIPFPLRTTPSQTAAAAAAAAAAAGVAAKHRPAAAGEAATVLAAAAVEAMQLDVGGSDHGTSPGVVVSVYPHKHRNPASVAVQSAATAAAIASSKVLASPSLAPTTSPLIRLLGGGGGGGGDDRELGGGGLQRELHQAAEETAVVRLDIVGSYCVATVRRDGVVVLNRL